jgi:glucokinase
MRQRARKVELRMATSMTESCYLAIDLGGTKTVVALADVTGAILARGRMETQPERGAEDTIARIVELAQDVLAERDGRPLAAGVASGGPLDPATGTIYSPGCLPGWGAVALGGMLAAALGCPVRIDNDANLGALGEHAFGAGQGAQDLVYITISTGIGGGVIVGGRLLHGVGNGAGEIGHQTVAPDGPECVCGNRGCLERMASGSSIARRAQAALYTAEGPKSLLWLLVQGRPDAVRTETVVKAAFHGDALAKRLWQETIDYLAIGVGNVITILAPERVIVGGGVAQAGDMLFTPLRAAVSERVRFVDMERVQILPAGLGTESPLYGALALARESSSR